MALRALVSQRLWKFGSRGFKAKYRIQGELVKISQPTA